MTKRPTPGRLALWALVILIAWVGYVLVANALDLGEGATPNWLAAVAWLPVLALLVMAGIAKAVEIGVRSGRD